VAIENAQLYEEVRDRAQRLEAIRGITTAIIAGEGSVTGEVIRTGKAVVLADASADERVVQPIVRAQVGPTMFVPLAVRGTILGTLTVANAKGGPLLREAAIPLVETFAEQAAVAIEYGRLQGELQRLALLEDRERIAKELHDGAIQALFAVGMGLQGSAALAASEELRGRLQDAVEEVDRVMRDLRTYIFGLRPAELTGRAADVIQLAREALSNVSRHAQAVTCRVSLYRDERGGVLEVDDDGHGFDPGRTTGTGQGLRSLRERAEGLGGRAEIDSTPGQGTRVR
jgi:signal transduction histidine kinase